MKWVKEKSLNSPDQDGAREGQRGLDAGVLGEETKPRCLIRRPESWQGESETLFPSLGCQVSSMLNIGLWKTCGWLCRPGFSDLDHSGHGFSPKSRKYLSLGFKDPGDVGKIFEIFAVRRARILVLGSTLPRLTLCPGINHALWRPHLYRTRRLDDLRVPQLCHTISGSLVTPFIQLGV